MSFTHKNEPSAGNGGLKKFSDWNGSWQSYLAYLDQHGALSSNLVQVSSGEYRLRVGYYPEWTLKDFR